MSRQHLGMVTLNGWLGNTHAKQKSCFICQSSYLGYILLNFLSEQAAKAACSCKYFYVCQPKCILHFHTATVTPCGAALLQRTKKGRVFFLTSDVKLCLSISQLKCIKQVERLQQSQCNKWYYAGCRNRGCCVVPVSTQYVGRAYVGIQTNLLHLLCQGSSQLLAKVRLAICLLSAVVLSPGAVCWCYYVSVIICGSGSLSGVSEEGQPVRVIGIVISLHG